jgi:superfamily II DNA helicase RecQ
MIQQMAYVHFQVPIHGGEAEAKLNQFLASHEVIRVEKQFLSAGLEGVWAYVVEFTKTGPMASGKIAASERKDGNGALVDWKEKLTDAEYARYLKLWHWRKAAAERDGVKQNFTIFTNAQLAEMAQKPPRSLADVRKIDGVGEGRVQKYGNEVLSQLRDETSDGPVPEDPGLEQSDPSLPSGEEGEEEPG